MKNCEGYEALASDCLDCEERKTCKYRKDIQGCVVAFSALMMIAVVLAGIIGRLIAKLIF